jgi:hypothetical protein
MGAMRKLSLAIVLLAAGIGAGCDTGSEDAPLQPGYEHDVKPLMAARCIRCHGAGGTLNLDPDIPADNKYTGPPTNGNFTQLQDDANGKAGLMYYASTGKVLMKGVLPLMPPPPAPPLTDRERTIILRWIDNPLP